MFIRSERLFLRPVWPEDWQDLLAGIRDEVVVRNLARAPWPYTAEDARHFADLPQDGHCPHFLVTRPNGVEGTEVIGGVGLSQEAGDTVLGYWIARSHWGHGYATEAGRAVLSLAPTLGHRRVTAWHFCDNPASGRVLAKLGFRPQGAPESRYSLARGCMALAQGHVLDLRAASNCDERGGDHGGSSPSRRAA